MNYRLANSSDIESLAIIHLECGKRQVGGFMHNLGLPFFKAYYDIILKEKHTIILVAENENKFICGFVSGTLATENFFETLRKKRLKLFFSVLPVLFKSPGMIKPMIERYRYMIHKRNSEHFGITSGPKVNYWAWSSESKSNTAIFLFKRWLNIVYNQNVTSVKGEVDVNKNNTLPILTKLGGRIFKEVKLKDGRPRVIIEFVDKTTNMGYRIRKMSMNDLDKVVQVHLKAFPGFFLTMLGVNFLLNLYKNFVLDDLSVCLIAENGSSILGFIVGNLMPGTLFKKMLIKKGFIFLTHSIGAFIRHPILVFKKYLYALNYRGDSPQGYNNITLLSSLGVDPDEGSKGVGRHLLEEFCIEAFNRGSEAVYLTTDKFGNDSVNSFYLKNGFHIESVIRMTGGRIMNRYIKLRDEKIL